MDEFKSGFLSIVGKPNVGKSTFLNNFVGAKVSIVTPKPQTTRDNIKAILNTEKMQLVFIDTPGLHKGRDLLGKRMSRSVGDAMIDADMVLLMIDCTKEMDGEDTFIINWLNSKLGEEKGKIPVFLLLNKVDLLEEKVNLLPVIDKYKDLFPFNEIIPLSSLKKTGFPVLLSEIYKHLSPGPAYYPSDLLTDRGDNFFVAELIREKVLLYTHQEIPHSAAVKVNEILPRKGGELLYISADIYVERKSQKGILIGKKGAMLKKIGEKARKEIEYTLEKKIYLELKIKVREKWRSKEHMLKEFGYYGGDDL